MRGCATPCSARAGDPAVLLDEAAIVSAGDGRSAEEEAPCAAAGSKGAVHVYHAASPASAASGVSVSSRIADDGDAGPSPAKPRRCCPRRRHGRAREASEDLLEDVLQHAVRVPDPSFVVSGRWIFGGSPPTARESSWPTCRRSGDELKLLRAMGWETANIHLGSKRRKIAKHLAQSIAGSNTRQRKWPPPRPTTSAPGWQRRGEVGVRRLTGIARCVPSRPPARDTVRQRPHDPRALNKNVSDGFLKFPPRTPSNSAEPVVDHPA